MAKTYTSTIQLKVWKEHTCGSCGAVYSYLFQRKITGSGSTADVAQQRARKNAQTALEVQVDMQPCPTCGIYQPDMLSQKRAKVHKAVVILVLLVIGVLAILRMTNVLQTHIAAWAVAGACAVAAMFHLAAEYKNLNADLAANRQLAASRIDAREVNHRVGPAGGGGKG